MSKPRYKRSLGNIVQDPGALWRLSIPFLFLLATSVGVILVIHGQILGILRKSAGSSPEVTLAIMDAVSSATRTGAVGLAVIGIVCVVFWLAASHRIFGPMVPIRRQIKSLIDGDYDARINLRSKDEFKEIAAALNTLAQTLKERDGK